MAFKFGISEVSSSTPIVYQRIETAVLSVVIPSVTAFVLSTVTDTAIQAKIVAGLVLLGGLIKGIGVFLGDAIPPPNTTVTTTTGPVTTVEKK